MQLIKGKVFLIQYTHANAKIKTGRWLDDVSVWLKVFKSHWTIRLDPIYEQKSFRK